MRFAVRVADCVAVCVALTRQGNSANEVVALSVAGNQEKCVAVHVAGCVAVHVAVCVAVTRRAYSANKVVALSVAGNRKSVLQCVL